MSAEESASLKGHPSTPAQDVIHSATARWASDSEKAQARTRRQRQLPQWGDSSQKRLAESTVAVIGAGGLGSVAIQYLGAAGVGNLHVFDRDTPELSNFNRQIIHRIDEMDVPKAHRAVDTVARLAPEVNTTGHQIDLTPDNIQELLAQVNPDVILDGSDSFVTRFMVDEAAHQLGIPVIFGALMQFSSQVTVFHPLPESGQPAVRLVDLFPDTPEIRNTPGCADTGILGSVAGMTGTIMATEALKLLTGIGTNLIGTLLVIDTLDFSVERIPLLPAGSDPDTVTESGPKDQPDPADSTPLDPVRGLVLNQITAGGTENIMWIDVRSAQELIDEPVELPGHYHHVPLDELIRTPLDPETLDTIHSLRIQAQAGREIITVCRSGPRSIAAARILQDHDVNVAGFLDSGVLPLVNQQTN